MYGSPLEPLNPIISSSLLYHHPHYHHPHYHHPHSIILSSSYHHTLLIDRTEGSRAQLFLQHRNTLPHSRTTHTHIEPHLFQQVAILSYQRGRLEVRPFYEGDLILYGVGKYVLCAAIAALESFQNTQQPLTPIVGENDGGRLQLW
jgi:hypothetical protein